MKSAIKILFNLLILSLLYLNTFQLNITFKEDETQTVEIKKTYNFSFIANYSLDSSKYSYLYIYPKNRENVPYLNKANIRIYFKQISSKDSNEVTNINYLNSDYSTIDFNSGLFIPINELTEKSATIFVLSYENITYLQIQCEYADNIFFPIYYDNSNYQLNQFILKKEKEIKITHSIKHEYDDYLLIFSKTSLRNIDVKLSIDEKDVTKDMLAYLYPNGCSVFLERSKIKKYINININNNNNLDEIITLGYMHHRNNPQFPNNLTNGFELYLEGNNNRLIKLYNEGNTKFEQYFTYQIYSKRLLIEFLAYSSGSVKNKIITEDYNSMFHFNINYKAEMTFNFEAAPKRSALYIQYLDYGENLITQKSLQPLVTGVPRSMIIQAGKSIYHFLPKERKSNNLYYYLRAKTKETLYVSFERCTSYPENCTFTGKGNNYVETIENIGLWYSLPTNTSELQLIYIYCDNECAYDILMTYDEDPFFLFPENDYTKLVGDSGKDKFALPVFEYFEKSNTNLLYIDLTIISGKVELILKSSRNGKIIDCNQTKMGQRYTYSLNISKESDYFKKEIYAEVEQKSNYKNSVYNIMYTNGVLNSKILKNNIVNMELLTVPEANKEGVNTKTFSFINKKSKFYVSISTNICKIIVQFNNKKYDENFYFHQVINDAGTFDFKVYLVRDDKYCTAGFEEEVILYAYDSENTNILLSENTLINSTISSQVSFTHLFVPKNDDSLDNSFNIEIERLNPTTLLFNYQLRKISFNGLLNKLSFDTSGQKIFLKTFKYISNEQIKKVCSSLRNNEVCSLTVNLIPSSSSQISLKIKKNSFYWAKNLTGQTLINSVNTKNAQYFYIDIDKNYNLRFLINSFGQDLKYNYELITEKKNDNDILPLKDNGYSNGLNTHQITILKNEFSNCNSFCRLYIGIKTSMGSSLREGSTPFSIGYQYYDKENKFSDLNLPLNYFSQYTLDSSEEVNYILYPFENGNFFLELYVIKQNENDDSEASAFISGSQILSSSVGKVMKTFNAGKIAINIKITKGKKLTFKFRVSSTGQQQIIPMISSYEEKCLLETCYYLLDDLTSEKLTYRNIDDDKKFVYIYIPEKEDSFISYQLLKYNEDFNMAGTFNNTSNDIMKRKNWLQIPIYYNEYSAIIKLENAKGLTLCSSNYNIPNTVTLNYGEKRMFSFQGKRLDNITFYINKEKGENKVKIKLHSIKGNWIFIFNTERYPLGFENAYKEDISIIISDENNIRLIAINEKNDKADEDDFVFTIEYSIDVNNQYLYEINYDKINSFKFYQNKKINEFTFYLDFSGRVNSDLNMNIKIYSNETIYSINSYFVDKDFIQKILNDQKIQPNNYNSIGNIKKYIQGGEPKNNIFTFAKLEISSDELKNQNNNNHSFIYTIFKLEEGKVNYKVKFDLYPYNIDNLLRIRPGIIPVIKKII